MNVICSILIILFLASTISALSLPASAVLLAEIYNSQNKAIRCSVVWINPLDSTRSNKSFTIEKKQSHYTGSHYENSPYGTIPQVIDELRCGKLTLKAPFADVRSSRRNWKFIVQRNKIVLSE